MPGTVFVDLLCTRSIASMSRINLDIRVFTRPFPLTRHNILSNSQYGFRAHMSTTVHAALELTESIYNYIVSKQHWSFHWRLILLITNY